MPKNNGLEELKGRIQSQNPGTVESVGLINLSYSAKDFRDRDYESWTGVNWLRILTPVASV
jgi:hypothetical protein